MLFFHVCVTDSLGLILFFLGGGGIFFAWGTPSGVSSERYQDLVNCTRFSRFREEGFLRGGFYVPG